jgi:2-oxo-4-hydroxy-4-carboxy-5-ureidoimidazoline decarboxylase
MTPEAVVNVATREEAAALLLRCCGSSRWVERMLERRPFASLAALHEGADAAWGALDRDDYLEAFTHHPRLGEDPAKLRERFAAADWSSAEQSRVAAADDATLEALRARNVAYQARFGFVFLLCATGKSAHEVLSELEARIGHDPAAELRIAADEQAKITHLRLDRLARLVRPEDTP